MGITILRKIFMLLVFSIYTGCGFLPLHNHPDSMDIFKNISIQSEDTLIAFLIKEALEEKAPLIRALKLLYKPNPP